MKGLGLDCSPVLAFVRRFHGKYRYVNLDAEQELKKACLCQHDKYNQQLPDTCQLDHLLKIPQRRLGYQRHLLLVSPGRDDWKHTWKSNLEQNNTPPFSYVKALKSAISNSVRSNEVLFNAVCLQNARQMSLPRVDSSTACFLVLPDFRIYTVEEKHIEDFGHFIGGGKRHIHSSLKLSFQDFVAGAATKELESANEVQSFSSSVPLSSTEDVFQSYELEGDVMLVCAHNQRDKRCGLIAPDIVDELQSDKMALNTNIGMVSHVGGHMYAGNMIWYRNYGLNTDGKRNFDALWFGKVMPAIVPTLVESVRNGVLIKDLFRGGFGSGDSSS